MRAVILVDEPGPDAPPDAGDALVQAEVFAARLRDRGDDVELHGAGLDLRPTVAALRGADLAVNLAESLDGRGALIHVVPALVEALGVPMTGCPADAIAATSCKPASKRRLVGAGLPTPAWYEGEGDPPRSGRWIVKSAWEHASIGLGPGSVVDAGGTNLRAILAERAPGLGGAAFAERFIPGREFNLSVLEVGGVPTVLPPAEIRFPPSWAEDDRIVGYDAKWNPDADAWHATPRAFDFPPGDARLLERLGALALRCRVLFGLRGSARVDFRVDRAGRAWILEVNTNPCVSPDAGFPAAAARAGLDIAAVVDLLIDGAMNGPPVRPTPDVEVIVG